MPSPSTVNMVVAQNGNEQQERKPRPQLDQTLKCPRCDSTNTKFCYYNNYSLSQPRYFCKSCRRYWTKGGTLRNVPVGSGCRKNRRSTLSSSKRTQNQQPLTPNNTVLPPSSDDTNDLSLSFARLRKQDNVNSGFDANELSMLGNPSGLTFVGDRNNFQGFYNYACSGEVDNGGGTMAGVSGDMMKMLPYNNNNNNNEYIINNAAMTTTDVTVATMKQELCTKGKQSEDWSVLWGLPWQLGGDHGSYNMADHDSGRESWGGLSSSWHGLLYSPLM